MLHQFLPIVKEQMPYCSCKGEKNMITNDDMWSYRYKDNVKLIEINNKEYYGSVIDIVDGEDAEGNDNLVLETNQGEIRWFEEKDIQTIGIQK